MLSNPSPSISRPVGVTSHTTPLAIRRGAGGEASVNSVCRRRSVGSKLCAKMLSELCVLCERKTFTKYVSSPIGVTSHITPLSIRRGVGGEASVISVCRRRSVGSKGAPKSSVKSVSSVREKPPHVLHASHLIARVFSISHRFTQKNRTHKASQRH